MPGRSGSLPAAVAWRHRTTRNGFEVLFLQAGDDALIARGCTSAVQDGEAWTVRYRIEVDAGWLTRRAQVTVDDAAGSRTVTLVGANGSWELDVQRLDQHYHRLPDADGLIRYDYRAPMFDFHAVLAYDEHGLIVDYPGLAVREGL